MSRAIVLGKKLGGFLPPGVSGPYAGGLIRMAFPDGLDQAKPLPGGQPEDFGNVGLTREPPAGIDCPAPVPPAIATGDPAGSSRLRS